MGAASPARARYDADLRRTVDRVGGLGLPRLAAGFAPEPTRADAVRALAQHLADVAADLAGEPRRVLPRLADRAVGDQLAVCGHDLMAAAVQAAAHDRAGAHDQAGAHDEALADAADRLLDLRRRL